MPLAKYNHNLTVCFPKHRVFDVVGAVFLLIKNRGLTFWQLRFWELSPRGDLSPGAERMKFGYDWPREVAAAGGH